MSGGMDRSCNNCAVRLCFTYCGLLSHKFPEEIEQPIKKENIPFFLQEQNPIYGDDEPLVNRIIDYPDPLEKLIRDHWSYNYDLLTLAMPLDVQEWGREEVLDLVEFVYKAAWKHGRKHTLEELGLDPHEVQQRGTKDE